MARRKMNEEQRAAAAANLAKARAAKKPASYKNIAVNVQALDEDHGLSMVNVKLYIKATKEKLSALRQAIHRGERGAQAYGENEEKQMYWKTLSPAYDKDGIQK